MKKLILLILILTNGHYAIAQVIFLPNKNTEWHYKFNNAFSSNINNESLKYVRDSVIGSEPSKVVSHKKFFRECNNTGNNLTVFKQKNDSVFFRNSMTNHQWQLLINFNALPTQSWTFIHKNYDNSLQTYTVTLDSVNTTVINATNLKYLKVTYKTYNSFISAFISYNSTIYERFGDAKFLFNFYPKNAPACDADYVSAILCYEDSTFGLKQFTSNPCNYSVTVGTNEKTFEVNNIKISPNPANETLIVKLELHNANYECKIKITNTLGQVVQTTNIHNQTTALNISELQNGIYFLQVFNNEKLIGARKIIKE